MNNNKVIIDTLTIHLPNGWQGDPVLLARQVSSQIQNQAINLQSNKEVSLSLQGQFAGNTNNLLPQINQQLSELNNTDNTRGFRK
jgi:hypothetical protein